MNGRTWTAQVRTFTRARQLASQVPATDQVSFVIGQFNMARAASFNQRLGKGTGDFDVSDGWLMRAHNPNLPWHFTDLDVLNQPADLVIAVVSGGYPRTNVVFWSPGRSRACSGAPVIAANAATEVPATGSNPFAVRA